MPTSKNKSSTKMRGRPRIDPKKKVRYRSVAIREELYLRLVEHIEQIRVRHKGTKIKIPSISDRVEAGVEYILNPGQNEPEIKSDPVPVAVKSPPEQQLAGADFWPVAAFEEPF